MLSFGCGEAKRATALHQSPEIRILPYMWILLDCTTAQRPYKMSGGPKFGSGASISSCSELHSLGKTG